MRQPRPLALAALATSIALLLAACSGAGTADEPTEASAVDGSSDPSTITVTHAQGETEVDVDPETVAVLDMGTLDTLHLLGVEVAGVPQANVPSFLSEYSGEEYTDIGTLFEPDYEALNALDPDLVIVAFRSAAAYPELAALWPTIDLSFESTDYLAGLRSTSEILGQVFDKEAEVAAALEDLEAEAAQVAADTADVGSGMVLSTSGGEVTVYGTDSRFGIIFSVLGVEEAVNDVEPLPHGEAISFELIRDTNPDWLFVNDRDAAIGESGQSAEQILDNELVASTTAWQNDQVVYLDAERWYIVMSGVSNAAAMFAEIGAAVAGD